MNGAQIVDAVVEQGGFDTKSTGTPRATVAGWVADRYDEMVARARWRRSKVIVGVVMTDTQDTFPLGGDVVELERLRARPVDESVPGGYGPGAEYARVGVDQVWELEAGSARLNPGTAGVYAPSFDEVSNVGIRVWPIPELGTQLEGLAALLPGAFQDAVDFLPIIPRDFHRKLIYGAVADGLRLVDERLNEADNLERQFEDAVQRLAMRQNSRVGQGPQQISVARRPR